ncbi:hypothetical protein ABT121_32205 [Streptomyces sp. NPDC001928]
MEYMLEVAILPVSDVDRSLAELTDPDGTAWTLRERGFRPS